MVTPPPRLVFVKSLFRFFSPIFKGKFFLGISVLFKGLLPCETIGTFGTFRYLSYLGHFWTIWATSSFWIRVGKLTDPSPPFEKVFLKNLHFLNDGFPYFNKITNFGFFCSSFSNFFCWVLISSVLTTILKASRQKWSILPRRGSNSSCSWFEGGPW